MKTKLWLAGLLLLWGCAAHSPEPVEPEPAPRQDELIGKIYDTQEARFVEKRDLYTRFLQAEVLYLGEQHSNLEHHRLQKEIILELIQQGQTPVIGIELFSQDQTPILLRYLQQPTQGVELAKRSQWLRARLDWQDQPSEEWDAYFAILELAREKGLLVVGLDLSRAQAARITNPGSYPLTPMEKRAWKDTNFSDPAYEELMVEGFTKGHCGWSDPKLMKGLYRSWLARNDAMAQNILALKADYPNRPVVVLLGGGHVEWDMAVFERVQTAQPKLRQINLGFLEIAIEPTPLAEYIAAPKKLGRQFAPPHRYFWFTQRESYVDPCKKYEKMLKKHKPQTESP